MARVLAHRKSAKQKTSKITRPAKKAKPKAAFKMAHGNASSKGKVSSPKAKRNESRKMKKDKHHQAHSVHRESKRVEMQSRKPAAKANIGAPSAARPFPPWSLPTASRATTRFTWRKPPGAAGLG